MDTRNSHRHKWEEGWVALHCSSSCGQRGGLDGEVENLASRASRATIGSHVTAQTFSLLISQMGMLVPVLTIVIRIQWVSGHECSGDYTRHCACERLLSIIMQQWAWHFLLQHNCQFLLRLLRAGPYLFSKEQGTYLASFPTLSLLPPQEKRSTADY